MEENKQEEDQQHLFDSHIEYTEASQGSRFLNWLIDNLLMQFGLSQLTGYAAGYLLGTFFPDYTMRIVNDENTFDLLLISYLIGFFNYLIYYTICEKAFKGHTLGKLITGTRAIREDGQELTFKDALLRSLSRIVPFEVFSGLGQRPWHDTWTKTTVVKTR